MAGGMRFYRALIQGFVFPCLLVAVLAGCGGGEEQERTLTVLAASSLTDAFGELSSSFEEQNPGVEVRASFAASSALLAQIQQGAPADVFAPADLEKMEAAVVEDGLVAGEPETFVRNREVVIVPKANPANIRSFRDLSGPGIRLVLAQDEVPAAVYARDILDNAAEDPGYGPGFRQAVLGNVVSREADVRASVNRAVVGDADATFGYASDVTPDIRDRVGVIRIPENLNVIATYPIAVLEGSHNKGLAREWIELLTSDEGQRVLEEWGFEPVERL